MGAFTARALLTERTAEIIQYVRFVRRAVTPGAAIVSRSINQPIILAKDLTHTFKATTYLLLYNAIEATMCKAIDDIHIAIRKSGAGVDDLRSELLLHVLHRFRHIESNPDHRFSPPVGDQMVAFWLNDFDRRVKEGQGHPLFSGNVDSREIRRIGKKYGFATGNDVHDAALMDESLLAAKKHRNDLGHGSTSFAECGRDRDEPSLRKEALSVLRCLGRVVDTVDRYILENAFLRGPGPWCPLPSTAKATKQQSGNHPG